MSVFARVHVSSRCTLIGLDRLGKVTSLPDCLDFPQRSNKWASLKYCSTMRWRKQIYGAKIYVLLCCHDNSMTGECNRVRQCGGPGAIFMHSSCFNLELQFDGLCFFFFFFEQLFRSKTSERREIKRDGEPIQTLRNLGLIFHSELNVKTSSWYDRIIWLWIKAPRREPYYMKLQRF